jgi:hypothetical protein
MSLHVCCITPLNNPPPLSSTHTLICEYVCIYIYICMPWGGLVRHCVSVFKLVFSSLLLFLLVLIYGKTPSFCITAVSINAPRRGAALHACLSDSPDRPPSLSQCLRAGVCVCTHILTCLWVNVCPQRCHRDSSQINSLPLSLPTHVLLSLPLCHPRGARPPA